MTGYIPNSRSFFESDLWNERRVFSKAEAYLDMCSLAAFKPKRTFIEGKMFDLEPGQLVASNRFLQTRWGWGSTKKVQDFLKFLQNRSQIEVSNRQKISHITISELATYKTVEANEKPGTEKNEADEKPDRSQLEAKIEERKKERNLEEEVHPARTHEGGEIPATPEQWQRAVRLDELFREQVARQHQIEGLRFDELLEIFYLQKAALGELTHGSYSDFRRNFLFWIPKNLNAIKVQAKNGNHNHNGNHPHGKRLITEETARRVFAGLVADVGGGSG